MIDRLDARLARVLKLESDVLGERSSALVGAPITINSALNRSSTAPVQVVRATPARPGAFETDTDDTDDEAPDWPPAEVEAAMSAEVAERDAVAPRSRSRKEQVETLDGGPLPALQAMLAQIPASLQEQLDELFRAKFTEVRRVPAAVLKINQVEPKSAGSAPLDEDPSLADEEIDDD